MNNHTRYNILVTRSLTEQQQEYAREMGLNPWVVPALRVEFPHNWKMVMRKLDQYPEAVWAFTSRNAVEALSRLEEAGHEIQGPASGIRDSNFRHRDTRPGRQDAGGKEQEAGRTRRVVFAVGGKTAEALEELGITSVHPEQQDASGLARLITDHFKTEKPVILHWCGNRRREELGNRLTEAGFEYVDMEVYQTEFNTIPWPEQELDAILFYSPSGVEAFRQSDGFKRPLPELFAIGNTTGEVLSLESGRNVHIPVTPSTEALLELTAEILNEKT